MTLSKESIDVAVNAAALYAKVIMTYERLQHVAHDFGETSAVQKIQIRNKMTQWVINSFKEYEKTVPEEIRSKLESTVKYLPRKELTDYLSRTDTA